RYFSFYSEASLYAAQLREAGIRCFISNANSVTILPVEQPGMGLHVRAEDAVVANEIIAEIEEQFRQKPAESYHDADEEEIEYLKSVSEDAQGSNALLWLVGIIISLLIFRAFARAAGWAP